MLCWFAGLLLMLAQLVSAQPGHIFVSAPNIIRVGNTETVLINVFDTDDLVDVTVTLKNVDQSEICPPQIVNVGQGNPVVVSLFIDPDTVQLIESEDEDAKLYAKLEVSCAEMNGFQEVKDVLVSYEEGFVFIQTDKPIYTPEQSVSIQLLILDQYLRPSDQEVQMDVLTPQGVIVHRVPQSRARNGFKTLVFRFPVEPLFGNWSVVAYYGKEMRSNRSVQFEVKEYILPTFSVELTAPDHILEGDEAMDFKVRARYVYDKPVQGYFYAKVGILEFDGEIDIKQKMAGQLIADGIGFFQIETEQLGDNWFAENVGKRLYVEVSVLETASGISENVSDISAMFVHSPYAFRWDRTVQYYKKGLPYQVKIDLLLASGKPADNVPVNVIAVGRTDGGEDIELFGEEDDEDNAAPTRENTNHNGQVNFRIYVPTNCEIIHITLETKREDLIRHDGVDNNARFEFDVNPYVSPSVDDFLMIRLTREFVNVDEEMDVEALSVTNDDIPWMAYYVVSKGHISQAGILYNAIGFQGFRIRVSYDMVPTARIVAFYINQAGQVIADSIWIEIQKVCENRVSLRVVSQGNREAVPVLEPDRNVVLQIDALPGTTVGLLAVDKAVYLLRDYHRLTSDKMYQTMDTYDTGCGPGGGRDTPDVFKNAGIMVLSSANIEVERRDVYGCGTPLNPRRRRSVGDELATQLAEYEGDANATFACRRGHKLLVAALNCEQRSVRFAGLLDARIPNLDETQTTRLLDIFATCCEVANEIRVAVSRGRTGAGEGTLADASLIEDIAAPGHIRSDFKETWIFEEVEVGENIVEQAFTIPSSITTWSINAVGLSEGYAMCVARPLDVLVRKDLFIQLHMPYSVVRKEQVEIVATIFNYLNERLAIRVLLKRPAEVCGEGNPNEWSAPKEVSVGPNDAVSVKYILIGLKSGNFPIEVTAFSPGPYDAVSKILRVVPEGIETSFYHSAAIDPTGSLDQPLGNAAQVRAARPDINVDVVDLDEESTQINIFDIRLPSSAVPESEKCEVSIIGSVLGPVVTAVIEGLESLLPLPRGCGEQTMIYMAPNVYVLRYLTSLDAATPELEAKAKSNIREGVVREMTHRRADGSYSVWGTNPRYPSSTWLTAFVNKVFCHASEFQDVFIDPKVICQAMEWLIDSAQRDDGAFYETYRVHHREMTGGVQGDATLTAFVLISIKECECATLSEKVEESTRKAKEFLEAQLDNMQRPYALAIVTYALALVGSADRHHSNLLLRSMDTFDAATGTRYFAADDSSLDNSDKPYWYQVRPSAITVETTGYALLAQLALGETTYSSSLVKWLSEQQNYGGGFASTQDTTIALQALSEYGNNNQGGELDMICSVRYNDRMLSEFQFTKDNALVQRHATPPANGSLTVTSIGTGTGKLNVRVTYNTISEDLNGRGCPFQMVINAREARALDPSEAEVGPPEQPPGRGDIPGRSRVGRLDKRDAREPNRGDLIVHVSVEVGYHKNEPTNMAIIDVGLYSGFKPIKEDLDQIVAVNDYISRYEISQRSVIFYADSIPPVDQLPKLKLEFNARRDFIVGNLQPVAIKVYDYYNPTEECVKFYHPTDESFRTLANICEGQTCVCAAGDCCNCTGKTKEELLEMSCESAQTYVYKIRILEKKTDDIGFKVYTALIGQVLKPADDEIVLDDRREFWISSSCVACTGTMNVNKWYLVIGKTVLPYVTSDNQDSFKYILDNSAVLELWPERPRRKVREQYNKLEGFSGDMEAGNNNCQ